MTKQMELIQDALLPKGVLSGIKDRTKRESIKEFCLNAAFREINQADQADSATEEYKAASAAMKFLAAYIEHLEVS